jgi:hypothetical protein
VNEGIRYKPDFNDRLRALTALAVDEGKREAGMCLSVEDMAALIDGNIPADRRDVFFRHIDGCPSCYTEWLAVSAEVMDDSVEETSSNSRLKQEGGTGAKRRTAAGALAIAASLALVVLYSLYHRPSIPVLVEEQYKMAFDAGLLVGNKPLPQEGEGDPGLYQIQRYGFAGSLNGPSSLSEGLFLSGFRDGRNLILDGAGSFKPSCVTENEYYWAGRWYALLSSVCESAGDLPVRFRDMQRKTAGGLRAAFKRHAGEESGAVILSRSVDRIDAEIERKDGRPCGVIRSELDFVLEGFSQRK